MADNHVKTDFQVNQFEQTGPDCPWPNVHGDGKHTQTCCTACFHKYSFLLQRWTCSCMQMSTNDNWEMTVLVLESVWTHVFHECCDLILVKLIYRCKMYSCIFQKLAS